MSSLFFLNVVQNCFSCSTLTFEAAKDETCCGKDAGSCLLPSGWGAGNPTYEVNFQQAMGQPCKFPFTYKGVTYESCTTVDHCRPWCYTGETATNGEGHWGNCGENCLKHGEALSFPCSQVPTCCVNSEHTLNGMYMPPAVSQATHIVGIYDEKDRDSVITDVASLDPSNRINLEVSRISMLKKMFMADLNPTELGFLLNDTRVQFVECNGLVSISTPLSSHVEETMKAPMEPPRKLRKGQP